METYLIQIPESDVYPENTALLYQELFPVIVQDKDTQIRFLSECGISIPNRDTVKIIIRKTNNFPNVNVLRLESKKSIIIPADTVQGFLSNPTRKD